MKKLSLKIALTALIGFFSLFSTSIFSQDSPHFEWATKAGGNYSDEGYSITVDNQGNSYITGYFQNTAIFGSTTFTSNGYYDIFIAKLDANGNYLWAKKAGGNSEDVGSSIAVDSQGNSYVTGYFNNT
ncbi:MAG TPA: SBBP repeat-containing protein, partial [Taishania sp.]|nr:SBBP repeat-containing protein [Taishania sp.]